LVRQDHEGQQDRKEFKDPLATSARKDHRGPKDRPENQESKVCRDNVAQMVHRVSKVNKDRKA
jgi:hypothetical protein